MSRFQRDGDKLIVYLQNEIDHCVSQKLREEIERRLEDTQIKRLILDFSEVSFMDSSGVGMIIGRYKTMSMRKGVVSAQALCPTVEKLFRMGGLHRIISIEG